MENVLPFRDVLKRPREHKETESKRKLITTVRAALKTISNNSAVGESNNEPVAKKIRLIAVADKENASNASQVSFRKSKTVTRSKPKVLRSRAQLPSDSNSGSSVPSSQEESLESHLEEYCQALNNFYKNDFALNLIKSNPSESIFEVPEYVVDIYYREQDREKQSSNLCYDFFSPALPPGVQGPRLVSQTHISKEILSIVVDWMVEVQENMEMNHETFYLAVIMMYRYMSVVSGVSKKTIQLLACTGMWLASKYEERVSPAVRDFMYICDDAFTTKDFITMEQKLFTALDESCHRPISYVFLRRYSRVSDGDNMQMQFLSRYYLELTLQNHSLMLHRESLKAAGALWLARANLHFTEDNRWPSILRFFTRFEESDLIDFVRILRDFAMEIPTSNLQTTYIKYSNKVFLEVAKIPQLSDHDFHCIIKRIRRIP